MERMEQPKRRSPLRSRLGSLWYGGLRRLLWIKMAPSFTRERSGEELPWGQTEHATPYWRCIGNPCRRRGFVEGLVLRGGRVCSGVGGGLCQMSNLICWMALHTPLTVVVRHHHGYDVFPDAGRTQPFGSGAI